MINKITLTMHNYWLKSLDTISLKPANINFIEVIKVFEPTIKKTWL